MKRATWVVVSLLVAAIASAQSLAEIAEKEKKRREQTRAEGTKVKEFTGGGGAPEVVNDESELSSESASEVDEPAETGVAEEKREVGSPTEVSEEWMTAYAEYKRRYRELESEMSDIESREREWCSPPPQGTPRSQWTSQAAKYKQKCRDARDDATRLRGEIRRLESDCIVEAKRYGVQPGDARLRR
jgi:hypothetical protein